MRNYFTFDGVDSRSFGVYISGQGTFKAPARSYDVMEIPGRDGALLSMDSRLGNTDLTYPAFIYSNFRENVAAFRAFLLSHKGYFKLKDSYHPGEYRMAYFPGPFEPDVTSANNAGSFDITFVCKPQRYLESGETVVELSPSMARVDTYTGDTVKIQDNVGDRITSLVAPIYPIQDLHGYASPWGPGGGVNICRVARAYTTTSQGITYSEDEFGTVHATGTATAESVSAGAPNTANADSRCLYTLPAGTYTIANISGVRIFVSFRNAGNTENLRSSLNIRVGNSYTYTSTVPVIIYIRADILTGETVDADMQVMVTAGSTAATVFVPFQNICPITGSTSITAYRIGKNKLPKGTPGTYYTNGLTAVKDADGAITITGTASSTTYILAGSISENVLSVGDILSGCPQGGSVGGVTYYYLQMDADGTLAAADVGSGASISAVGTNNMVYIYIRSGYEITAPLVFKPMVRDPSTDAEYEPYNRGVYTVNWSTQAGEVYGGTLDLVSGVLTVDTVNIPTYNGETINEPWLSSMDAYAPGTTPTIGAQVVSTLANPIEYQLTPQQIALLSNALNYIWSDSGPITVEVTEGLRLDNPTLFDALPLLRVYGSGVLGVGSHTITITAADEYTDIDCEMMDCFKGSENKNQYVQFSGNDFPTLEPGINGFTFSGIEKVEVKPRWWSV